ncbi:MAG: ferritin-like domain-containing protein [Elainellaceae cyanobacterium]
MNPLTPVLHLIGSGAAAYLMASQIRDAKTRPNVLAGFQMAESGAVPMLTKLRDRAQSEGDDWLTEKLTIHANDERRHGQIFANALKQLNKEIVDVKAMAEKAEKEGNTEQRGPFLDAFFKGYSREDLKPERIDWPVFFASAHILEADAHKDFHNMAQALRGLPDMDNIRAGIESVAKDEARHAAYLKEAMVRRYGYATTTALIDEWRSRKVDALMAMVGNMIQKGGEMRSLAQDRTQEPMQARDYERAA